MSEPTEIPTEITVELPHLSVGALVWGPPDGPLVLCLHGYPDTAWTWRHLGPALAERGYRVVAPFTRGYAPTSIPTDRIFHPAALMADALDLHKALGGDDRAILAGHDWGAITANGVGAHPDSPFRRIVSMAVPPLEAFAQTGGRTVHWLGQLGRQLPKSWYIGLNQIPALPERLQGRMVPLLWKRWSPGYDGRKDVALVLESLSSPESRSAALGYYRDTVRRRTLPASYRESLKHWQGTPLVPTLYLHGADDGCLHKGFAEAARRVLPSGSEVHVVAAAGHFLHLEQPETAARLVLSFLAQA